jgi:hypothetical protein
MTLVQTLQHPVPEEFIGAATHVVNEGLNKIFGQSSPDMKELDQLVQQIARWSLPVHKKELSYQITGWVSARLEDLQSRPFDLPSLNLIQQAFQFFGILQVDLDLWKAQNAYFKIGTAHLAKQKEKADAGDQVSRAWLEAYARLGSVLRVKVG